MKRTIYVITEHDDGKISRITWELFSFALADHPTHQVRRLVALEVTAIHHAIEDF